MNDFFDQLVLDHFSSGCELMEQGEICDSKGLVEPDFWYDIVPCERHDTFDRPLAWFVEQGLLPLELVGYNSRRHNLYRKILS